MRWIFGALLFFIFRATRVFAADCIIVGAESSYRIPDCVENSSIIAIQKILGSNYAIITDRKYGKILAVFLAETSRKSDDANHQSQESADQPPLPQPAEQYQSIEFPFPISLSSAEQTLNDLRSQSVMPAQFMVSFGEYQVLYDLDERDTITSVLEKEKSNLLNLLDRQKQAILEQPSESAEKSLQMVEQGRSDLLNNDVILKSVSVLQQ